MSVGRRCKLRVIGGTFKRRSIHGPEPDSMELRPTHDRIRENVFNLLAPYVQGATFLDLYAGCGCMGIESLSRGAVRAVFVDNSSTSVALIRKNIETFDLQGQSKIFKTDVLTFIRSASGNERFDIIYVDPPYYTEQAAEVIIALGDGKLLSSDAIVIAEHKRPPEFTETGVLKRMDVRKYSRKTWISVWKPGEGLEE